MQDSPTRKREKNATITIKINARKKTTSNVSQEMMELASVQSSPKKP
jgi:hypothetical protein